MAPDQVPDQAPDGSPDRDRDGTDRQTPDQPTLPFEEREDPIPYALTARARRTVAPASLPELSVVPDPGGARQSDRVQDPDPFDPRPARARALRRAGRGVSQIADLLEVGEELVTAWCRTVGPRAERRRARASGGSGAVGRVGGSAAGSTGGAQVRHLPLPEPDQHAPQRQRGHDHALENLAGDVRETLAFLAGRARVTTRSATFRVDGPDLAARIVGWLVDLASGDPSRARLVLEVGPGVAHDLVEARWERGTGIPAEHIAVSRGAVDDEVRATLRIADPDVAAILAGWQDAFMEASARRLENA